MCTVFVSYSHVSPSNDQPCLQGLRDIQNGGQWQRPWDTLYNTPRIVGYFVTFVSLDKILHNLCDFVEYFAARPRIFAIVKMADGNMRL